MTNLTCSKSPHLQNISENCLIFPNDTICFPSQFASIGDITGVWCFANAIVGSTGNLLTMIAIPYAAKRRKFNLHRNWITTIFVINLAFADFLYCTVNLPLYALNYLNQGWFWGKNLCQISTAFRYVNAFADWMSVAMIAVSRCLTLTRPTLGDISATFVDY